jgi:muramoyltetrapeptide carboxypeptidase
MIAPNYLNAGDKIAIVAPAGKISPDKVKLAIQTLEGWGLVVELSDHVLDSFFQYASSDLNRMADFQAALDNKEISAILCARGGYGSLRIIDSLDFSGFLENPKWIIGFSDITILHSHIHTNVKVETIHGMMAAGFIPDSGSAHSIESLQRILFGQKLKYELENFPLSRKGKTKGILTGGNLAVICSLIGSVSDIDTSGKILFIEEIGEHLYRIDRMMWMLKRAGKLDELAGLIVGGMTDIPDEATVFGKTAYEIIAESVVNYSYPVCYGFPAGHQEDNRALILGREVVLEVGDKVSLQF